MSVPEDPTTAVERLMMRAARAHRDGDFGAVTRWCELARRADPSDPAPVAAMAFIALNQGDLPRFQGWITAALELTPWGGRASLLAEAADQLAGRGMTSANPKDYLAIAVEYLAAAVEYAPPGEAAAMLVRRGNLQSNMTRPVDALQSYESALQYRGADAPVVIAAYSGLVRCLMMDGQYPVAVGYAQAVCAVFSDDPSVWILLGTTLQACERYGEAVMAYQEAWSRGSHTRDVLVGLATCHHHMGHEQAALEYLGRVPGAGMPPRIADGNAPLFEWLGRPATAGELPDGRPRFVSEWIATTVSSERRDGLPDGHTRQTTASLN